MVQNPKANFLTEQAIPETLPSTNRPVLEALGITKSFGGIRALKGVSLQLFPGEVHALVGENGAGKSTLIKILTGAVQPDSGEIWLRGERLEGATPALARSLGISVVYQEPALFPDLTVSENLALGRETRRPWHRVGWKARTETATTLLSRVGARISPHRLAGDLSMPEQQLVEIAKSLDANTSVLILDEPTASLGEQDAENLFRIIEEVRSAGTAVVYISHRFEELFRLAHRVTILRDGNSIETRPMDQTKTDDLIRLMVGRDMDATFPPSHFSDGEVALEVKDVESAELGVKGVSLVVRRGEILGLAGLVGAGRTQLAEVIFGLAPMDRGEVLIEGRKAEIHTPSDAVAAGVAYVPEDRRHHGVILGMSVATNTTLASLRQVASRGFLRFEAENERAQEFAGKLRIKTASTNAPVRNLSGGNQQKVALARWLMTRPKILILDEPTQGIDVGAKAEIYRLMRELAEGGMAILMISSDTTEVLGMSDRIAVMAGGKIAGVLPRPDATPYAVLALALGHTLAEIKEGER
jgi:rhamnose transport system ATP-binding protein